MVQPATRTRTARRATYVLIRITGVGLAVLALGHFAVTHIVNDVAETDASFVAQRWSSALWIGWDALLLGMALLHVGAAMSAVVRDYCARASTQQLVLVIVRAFVAMLFVIGTVTLVVAAG